MAKLGAYYGLCPLIDHRSLLGISHDEETGVVIVTLGKNISIKFRLSDQKQLYSWRTKDKFSSPIIYDKEQFQYVAVFNESFVRTWKGDEEFLDKLKKLKFDTKIHTIFICDNKSFIVFKNGALYSLNQAIENRKNLSLFNIIDVNSEYITDVLYTKFSNCIYVGLIVNNNNNFSLYWTKFNELNEQDKIYQISLKRTHTESVTELRGYMFHMDKTGVNFLSLWNDGRLYSAELREESLDIGELFTVVEAISCKEHISMISLDNNYIAMYGCNSNEEGSLLVIYNVQFKVIQTRQAFKLFTNGAKIWRIDENLLFPVGRNLAALPFHLDMEQLAALVGSHKVIDTNPDPDISIVHKIEFANWGKEADSQEENVPKLIENKVKEFVVQGLTKNLIFETLLEELCEKKNLDAIRQTLNYFTDIPENGLIKLLKLILNLEFKLFKKSTQSNAEKFPANLQPVERTKLLDLVFTKSFNATLVLPYLRSYLTLDEVLLLLEYIYFLLSEEGHCLPEHNDLETEKQLIEWSCILLDANYQKFLLTRDKNVNEILISLKDRLKQELESTEDLKKTWTLLYELKKNGSLERTIHTSDMDYSIEEFRLY